MCMILCSETIKNSRLSFTKGKNVVLELYNFNIQHLRPKRVSWSKDCHFDGSPDCFTAPQGAQSHHHGLNVRNTTSGLLAATRVRHGGGRPPWSIDYSASINRLSDTCALRCCKRNLMQRGSSETHRYFMTCPVFLWVWPKFVLHIKVLYRLIPMFSMSHLSSASWHCIVHVLPTIPLILPSSVQQS